MCDCSTRRRRKPFAGARWEAESRVCMQVYTRESKISSQSCCCSGIDRASEIDTYGYEIEYFLPLQRPIRVIRWVIKLNIMTTEKMNEILLGSAKSSPVAESTIQSERSDLARIDIKSEDPLDLFKEWHEDARKYSTGSPDALCLATVSKDLKVSARHLLLRHYDERGFIVVTDNRSRKCKELAEVPSAAMCILWAYVNDRQERINRQVRMEGKIEQLSCEEFRHLYDREPFYCKIRSYLCCQDEEIDWEEQKIRHDKLVNEVNAGNKNLPMPDHFVAYRLTPDLMEYYFAHDHLIADRFLFTRESAVWTHRRIAA